MTVDIIRVKPTWSLKLFNCSLLIDEIKTVKTTLEKNAYTRKDQ